MTYSLYSGRDQQDKLILTMFKNNFQEDPKTRISTRKKGILWRKQDQKFTYTKRF